MQNMEPAKIKILKTDFENLHFKELTSLLDEELNKRYGVVQDQYNKFNKIDAINNVIVLFYEDIPIGCGCFKMYTTDIIEIKRMFVLETSRGMGYGGKILKELEIWAFENGNKKAVLETGKKQPEAIGLYQKHGYQVIENYGQYKGNSNSVCMEKEI
jgi:putative acetyltransferase